MHYRELGNTGLKISVIGLGTNRLAGCGLDLAYAILNRLLDKGVNYISSGYGDTQEWIGNSISHRRDEFFLSSKSGKRTAEGMSKEIDESLNMFRTDYIDIYEFAMIKDEADFEVSMGPGGAIEGLLKAKEAGKIGHIGMTSHRPDIIVKGMRTGYIETALFMLSAVQPYAIKEVLPIARELGVGTMGMRPISHGALKPVDKALSFALTSGIDVVLAGMCSEAEVGENIAIAEKNMTEEEIRILQEEFGTLELTGCRHCNLCGCPKRINISFLLPLEPYRERYGLLPGAEGAWQNEIEKAKSCDDCGDCERQCPYGLPIINLIHEIAEQK